MVNSADTAVLPCPFSRTSSSARSRVSVQAVATNRDIGAAVGILMHARHLTYEQAFGALVPASQHSNTKLHTICRRVLTDRVLLAAPGDGPRTR